MTSASEKFLSRPRDGGALRILVVDDDQNTLDILLEALGLFGAEVCCAGSVGQARTLLAAWHADVLLSDLGMPHEDGFDLIQEVRTRPPDSAARMPAIALTGHTRAQDRQRALQAGYDEVLVKPAELDTLLQAIRRVASADPRSP
ncbi:MAG TPA: response regulator [Burkholderiales bacterium]|nr:response regulator [Burkholderiales bacterium]